MITIDPGKKTGWARFFPHSLPEHRVLVGCGLWDIDDRKWKGNLGPPDWDLETVIEKPVIYPRSKARPNDIITLAILAGRIAGLRPGAVWVEPRKWKGNLDGDLMNVRILKALTEEERRVYFAAADKVAESYRHNIIDAIGIGLWKLGRLTP